MFRGITLREQRIGLALTALIFAGLWMSDRRAAEPHAPITIQGPAIVHEPGKLVDPGDRPVPATPRGPLDLNAATTSELEALPGIGPSRAASILKLRDQRGGFTSVEDLKDVRGIGPKSLEELRPLVTIAQPPSRPAPPLAPPQVPATRPGSASVVAPGAASTPALLRPPTTADRMPAQVKGTGIVSLNRATADEFATLEGIGERLAARIVEERTVHGRFRSVDDLARVRGIGPKTIDRNRARLIVD